MAQKFPKKVQDAASRIGNSINYAGKLDGKEVYSVFTVDRSGNPIPTGLPDLLLFDGESVERVSGYEALDLLGRFD